MTGDEAKTWQVVAAFSFGVVFVVAILAIAIYRPNPTPFEYTIFRIVISLAAAGVGAIIPGFLNVSFKNLLRAGGALALFVVVYFFAPALPTTDDNVVDKSNGDAKISSDNWLKLVDSKQYQEAYQSMANGFKDKYPYQQFEEILVRERTRLGSVSSRQFISSTPYQNPPGAPKGAYRQYVYKTMFSAETQKIYEVTWAFWESDMWRVVGFNTMVKSPAGQFVPYEAQ